jgi:hypothetical protein
MKPEKIKRYRLGISRNFPTTHPRKGEPTQFEAKIQFALHNNKFWQKLHTIRANYPLWEKRMKEVKAGRAVIELFYWSGKPYNSPQVVFATLDKDSGCGVQQLSFDARQLCEGKEIPLGATVYQPFEYKFTPSLIDLAKNDGLSLDDFKAWFKKYDLSQPMAIIHFTSFIY